MKNYLVSLIILLSLVACKSSQLAVFEPVLIAHAGGAIDGNIYTNSREAMLSAERAGYCYIEFDLQYTSDSVLVAAHSWNDFNEQTGYPQYGDSVPSSSDFFSRRIYGKYTPLSASEIDSFFMANRHLYLVVDKISNPDLLERHFPELKERMVVEAFNYDDYAELQQRGFGQVFYSCMAEDLSSASVKHLLMHNLFKGEKIEWLAMHAGSLDNGLFKFLKSFSNFKIALFTVNNLEEVPEKLRRHVGYIYTDYILPVCKNGKLLRSKP